MVPDTSHLDIWLRSTDIGSFLYVVPFNPMGAYRPDPAVWDLGLLQSYETFSLLEELTGPRRAWVGTPQDRMIDLAEAEGLFSMRSEEATPEEALLALQIEWFRSENLRSVKTSQFMKEHLPAGETFATIGEEGRRKLQHDPDNPYPTRDTTKTIEWAESILEQWPDHPVSDMARLALIDIRASEINVQRPPDREGLLALLADVEDPVIREQAALIMTRVRRLKAGRKMLDAMMDIEGTTPMAELNLASWGLMQTTLSGRWEWAGPWSERFESALAQSCGVDPDNEVYACGDRTHELLDTNARLIALGHKSPSTWKEALVSQAWSCHLETPHEGTSSVEAIYDGDGWVYGAWDYETDVTRCLSAATHLEVMPDEPTKAKIVVHDVDPMAWTR